MARAIGLGRKPAGEAAKPEPKAKTARAKPGRKRAAATKQATAQEDPATNTQPKSDNENVSPSIWPCSVWVQRRSENFAH